MSAGRAIASASDEAPPPELVRDVLLLDGSTLRLRAPTPDDAQDIDAFYQRLSPESRYMRFHGYGRTDTAARKYLARLHAQLHWHFVRC